MAQQRNLALDWLAYAALRSVVAVIQALPLSVCERGSEALGWLAGTAIGFRRKLVDENLRTAFPDSTGEERRAIARRTWKHLFLMAAEIAHTPRKLHRSNWRAICTVPDERQVVRTMLRDDPKVLISGHYGNFEFGGYLLGMLGFPTHTVARPLDNVFVDRFVNDFRGRTGQRILPKKGSSDDIERVMQAGGALTLLGDQSAGRKGCWVTFFGKKASTHKAVSLFSLTYRAPTMVVYTRRREAPFSYEIGLAGEVDPGAADFEFGSTPLLTEWFTRRLEEVIARHPDQYWWVHNRWKAAKGSRATKRVTKLSAGE
ncbi:Lipid A biosynthesis lauroyl acyltransferase [Pseudobythopirellula maris]|uniref:Lipid A biosynthesis lauroyl acyltransferase n=1 Tax=Pseudobythopirellula maris TaxID=2527991 RepID=A0A5C5ZT63_9BACT|nr:lysophospholipid acyltransferase family protein [Pseudobythopirellula maris]TWT90001.1 Lipid A biosynthesis lauroyl acyltransferase [Pseudobythopirellula maris]